MNAGIELIRSLRPNLEVVDVESWSKDEWLNYRTAGIGCSEVGTIAGYNNFQAPHIVWGQKVGIYNPVVEDNAPMFFGRFFEPKIADLWQYWNPNVATPQDLFFNYENGIKHREVHTPKFYAVNPKYPYLFGGTDGVFINEHGDLSVLEIKTIASFAADRYESGIPTAYVFQTQAYMMLFEIDYCEMVILKDGREFEVIPFEANLEIQAMIHEICSKFWYEHVVPAIECTAKGDYDTRSLYEPSAEEFPYLDEQYLKERFKDGFEFTSVDCTEEIQTAVEEYDKYRTAINDLDKLMVVEKNKICRFMQEAEVINGVSGYDVSWKSSKRGRTFRVKAITE